MEIIREDMAYFMLSVDLAIIAVLAMRLVRHWRGR
ncbi:MAG: hypothetical protein Greene041619_205 [Candidatus Peregrinibacteria bacterium Greene0416_19]|nr:MAG: hypothetical protein Greene041619_205 [Candidatus Peregrinibacteria bacterium Greene0416_19]